jgi:hypothetical protein
MYNSSLHVNPKIRNFWKDLRNKEADFHIFKKNRNLVYFGDDLSRKSYDFVTNRIKSLDIQFDLNNLTHSFFNALLKERGNEEQLKDLAINAVSEAFEISKDILKAHLNVDNIDVNSTDETYPDDEYNYEDLSPCLKDQINKRILLNCVSQGASIHAFYTMHHLVKNELSNIDKDIVEIYDEISVGTVSTYWKIDYSSMLESSANLDMLVQGSSKVEYDEQDNPSVVAKARTFVVLCQELVKGSIDLINFNGLKDLSEEDLKVIYAFADKRVDEPRYIQVSSEIWRSLLSLIKHDRDAGGKTTIPEFVMKIAQMNPKDIEDFFELVLSDDMNSAVNFINNNNEGEYNCEDFE